jgi:hypothetical protein
MDKIWIVYNKGSYKKKYRIYKTEADMAKNISDSTSLTILEYELKSSVVASEYLKSKERDTQLRTILGELSEHEINAQKLIDLYEEISTDRYKKGTINQLKKLASDKKSFSSYLVRNKKTFFELSDSLEWISAILKCHSFQDHVYDRKRWNSSLRVYEIVDNSSDLLKENFKLAKEELKKSKQLKTK